MHRSHAMHYSDRTETLPRKADRWPDYSQALIDGLTVRQADIDCGIRKDTVLLWLHRFLQVVAGHRAKHESGIAEADETFFQESLKGQRRLKRVACRRGGAGATRGTGQNQIPAMVARDCQGHTTDFKLAKLDTPNVQEAQRPLSDAESLLRTDGDGAYATFARDCAITHQVVHAKPGQRVRDGAFHIRDVTHITVGSRIGWRVSTGPQHLVNYIG